MASNEFTCHSTSSRRDDAMLTYPRVLIVHMTCLNASDQHGFSLRSWFAEWPNENLAQIYSGGEVGDARFCGRAFKLGPPERRWGNMFFKLKESQLGEASYPVTLSEKRGNDLKPLGSGALLRHRLSECLVKSGLWEVMFPPILSARLEQWVRDFAPQVIYCQGYSLGFAWLPMMLKRKFKLPVCFQTGDDWPKYLYQDSAFSWAICSLVRRAARDLVGCASMRFANGARMALEFSERYGVEFVPMMMGDSIERFRQAVREHVGYEGRISVAYMGNLGHRRWVSVMDLCHAASSLRQEGYDIMVTAFVSFVPQEALNLLHELPNLKIIPSLAHELVPAALKGADILFLPEPFDPVEAAEIRLSISTKAHLYMMSERPILVYGSPLTGTVDYAKREGWGYIVCQRGEKLLVDALRRLIGDAGLRESLIRRGLTVALNNHDEASIRQRFLVSMQQLRSQA